VSRHASGTTACTNKRSVTEATPAVVTTARNAMNVALQRLVSGSSPRALLAPNLPTGRVVTASSAPGIALPVTNLNVSLASAARPVEVLLLGVHQPRPIPRPPSDYISRTTDRANAGPAALKLPPAHKVRPRIGRRVAGASGVQHARGQPRLIGQPITVGWFALRKLRSTTAGAKPTCAGRSQPVAAPPANCDSFRTWLRASAGVCQ